ncbi:MAG: hypothetical protein AAF468_06340 [Pseudomonadota bacterium]
MRVLSIALMVAAASLLSGCVTPSTKPLASTPISLTDEQIEKIQTFIRLRLKDPNSAIFSTIVASRLEENGAIVACGFVNAKNSFGGYTGRKPFLAGIKMPEGQLAVRMTDELTNAELILNHCRISGVTPVLE